MSASPDPSTVSLDVKRADICGICNTSTTVIFLCINGCSRSVCSKCTFVVGCVHGNLKNNPNRICTLCYQQNKSDYIECSYCDTLRRVTDTVYRCQLCPRLACFRVSYSNACAVCGPEFRAQWELVCCECLHSRVNQCQSCDAKADFCRAHSLRCGTCLLTARCWWCPNDRHELVEKYRYERNFFKPFQCKPCRIATLDILVQSDLPNVLVQQLYTYLFSIK